MGTNIFRAFMEGAVHQSWKAALILYVAIVSIVIFDREFIFWTMVLYVVFTLVLVKKEYWQEIRLQRPTDHLDAIWKGLGLMYASFFGVSVFLFLIWGGRPFDRWDIALEAVIKFDDWEYFPITFLTGCIIIPIAEELFFRGLLLKSFESRFTPFSANLLHAFLYGFTHLMEFEWVDSFWFTTKVFPTILAGVVYGWVAQRTGSVLCTIAVHSLITLCWVAPLFM